MQALVANMAAEYVEKQSVHYSCIFNYQQCGTASAKNGRQSTK